MQTHNTPINPVRDNQQPAPGTQEQSRADKKSPPRLRRSISPALSRLPRHKIAHLPLRVRDSINTMLRDRVSFPEILRHLGDAGKHLNKDNLLRWKKTGYQDWLKDEQRREDSHARIKFLLGLVKNNKNTQILKASQQIAVLQIADVLAAFDPKTLKESLQADTANYVRLLSVLPRLCRGSLACERHTDKAAAT